MARRINSAHHGSRRAFLTGAAATGTVLAAGLRAPAVLAATRAPLKIGILNEFTGINAVPTDSNLKGMSLYFDRIGWKIAGRKIKLFKEDDQFNPQIGLQKIRELVESDHVDVICGSQASNVTIALLNYARQSKTFIMPWAGTDIITREGLPYLFRPSLSSWQLSTPMAGWYIDHVGKNTVLAAADFAAGHDVMSNFKSAFLPKGGKVLKEVYPPLGTTDYSAYITDIESLDPPGVYGFFTGTDAVRFVQQYAQLGLKKKIRLTGFSSLIDGTTMPAQGDAALGVITSQTYIDTLDNPANKAFVAAYRGRYKTYPDIYSEYGFVTAKILDIALTATGGDASNKDRLAEAMSKVSFEAPRGPFRFDPKTHNPIQNVYITDCVKIDGRITQKAITTIHNVRDPGMKQA